MSGRCAGNTAGAVVSQKVAIAHFHFAVLNNASDDRSNFLALRDKRRVRTMEAETIILSVGE